MPRIPSVRPLLSRIVLGWRAREDEQNARRLADHLGCSMAEARTLVRLSRDLGYGAAHVRVFGTSAPVAAAGDVGPEETLEVRRPPA